MTKIQTQTDFSSSASSSVRDLQEKILPMPVISTHEHLWDESWRLEKEHDWTDLFFHYGITALKSAGLSDPDADTLFANTTAHAKKWALFAPFFEKAKNSAYIKAPLLAIRDIYGLDRVDQDSMAELTRLMGEKIKPGFYRKVLQEKARIPVCLVNCFDRDENGSRYPARLWGDTELLRPDLFGDIFLFPNQREMVERLTGQDCGSLSGWLKAIDIYFAQNARQCVSIKIAHAYSGRLNFADDISFAQADQVYNAVTAGKSSSYEAGRPLVDYLFHVIVQKALEYKMPLKFHTGLYSAANTMNFPAMRYNIQDLASLSIKYPGCPIIAMHTAYPYQDELVLAIRQITNLYADMSWSWLVDPYAARKFLQSALTAAPVNKVMAFGGDYSFPENTYGSLVLTKMFMAEALDWLIGLGYFSSKEATKMAKYLLYENAVELYQLKV